MGDSKANQRASDAESWLSLGDASRQMGVSAATLRMWADEGRVQSYRTPGGHRRFRLGAADALSNEPRSENALRWRVLEHSALGRMRLALEEFPQGTWLASLPPQAKEEHQRLGREMVRLLITALQKEKMDADARADALGKRYAALQWRYTLKPREALAALGFFRNTFSASVIEFAFGVGQTGPDQLILWLGCVNQLIDRVAISMLDYPPEQPTKNVTK